jgi:uncharacterized Zn finger protein (UPF0148 family)
MAQLATTPEQRFRPAPATLVRRLDTACPICGKVLAVSWGADKQGACICPDCLTRVYQRSATGQ